MTTWLRNHIGAVRLRQLVEDTRHRLAFVPLTFLFAGVVLSQLTLLFDRQLDDQTLPTFFETTVDSARAILGAIAGGLITAVTLLVSMVLVAVQLASGQLSPRTLRNWLGDAVLQRAVGIVLGTTVFCLLGLRSARQLGDDLSIVPSTTVLVGVLLAILSLVYVVRAVDQVTKNLQIGTIAQGLTNDTIETIRQNGATADARPRHAPVASPQPIDSYPDTAIAVECGASGWIQQIDAERLLHTLPSDATAWVVVIHGGFAMAHSPLAWVDFGNGPSDDVDDEERAEQFDSIRSCFALGSSRTMQQDVGFGTGQLTDIAVRALSPGTNDPQTARDILMHLGEILGELWAHEPAAAELEGDGRRVVQPVASPEDHLRSALDPIRHYGRHDPAVMRTMAQMLQTLRAEIIRRELPNPIESIDTLLDELIRSADDGKWTDRERAEFAEAARRHKTAA